MAHEPIPDLPLPPEKWRALARSFDLSPQQTRIVELILRNCCDKQIAAKLGLKVPTVRTYLKRTYLRLGVEDRLSLVLKNLRGLLRDAITRVVSSDDRIRDVIPRDGYRPIRVISYLPFRYRSFAIRR